MRLRFESALSAAQDEHCGLAGRYHHSTHQRAIYIRMLRLCRTKQARILPHHPLRGCGAPATRPCPVTGSISVAPFRPMTGSAANREMCGSLQCSQRTPSNCAVDLNQKIYPVPLATRSHCRTTLRNLQLQNAWLRPSTLRDGPSRRPESPRWKPQVYGDS